MEWLAAFAHGLRQDQREFGISLYGGDTTSTPGPLTIAITAFGFVPKGTMIRRAGAKPGDLVFVSGTIGDAGGAGAASARRMQVSHTVRDFLVHRYRVPQPRLALGQRVARCGERGARCFGWIACRSWTYRGGFGRAHRDRCASRCRSRLRCRRCGAMGLRRASGRRLRATITKSPSRLRRAKREDVIKAARDTTAITQIGRVVAGQGVALLDDTGREIAVARRGYTHF